MAKYLHFTQDFVRQCVDYDAQTGLMTWKHRPLEHFSSARVFNSWNAKHEGRLAFNQRVGARPYQRLGGRLDGIQCLSHRVAWFWINGVWPEQIDHIDGDPTNNRLTNLRRCDQKENSRNLPMLRTNKSGCMGVSWCSRTQKWRARIAVKPGHTKTLGHSDSYDDAVRMRKAAEVAIGYHANHGRAN